MFLHVKKLKWSSLKEGENFNCACTGNMEPGIEQEINSPHVARGGNCCVDIMPLYARLHAIVVTNMHTIYLKVTTIFRCYFLMAFSDLLNLEPMNNNIDSVCLTWSKL